MDRSSHASLSPQELASLRRIGSDLRQSIPSAHQQLLFSMHLVRLTAGVLSITEQGRQRLLEQQPHPGEQQGLDPSSSHA